MSLSFDISLQHRDNEFHDSRVLDMLFSHPYFTLYFILAFLFIMWETTKGTINDEKDTNIIREKALVQSEDTMYFRILAKNICKVLFWAEQNIENGSLISSLWLSSGWVV